MSNKAVSIHVKAIKQILEEEDRALTIPEIANRTGLHQQTIRNHINAGINAGIIAETGEKLGKAILYTSAAKRVSIYPSIQWGKDTKEIRELFNNWCTKGLPPNANGKRIARIIIELYELTANFALDTGHSDMSYQTKLSELKIRKARLAQLREHFRDMVAITNSIIDLDIFEPKSLVKELLIKDEELASPQSISSLLDTLKLSENPNAKQENV